MRSMDFAQRRIVNRIWTGFLDVNRSGTDYVTSGTSGEVWKPEVFENLADLMNAFVESLNRHSRRNVRR